MKGTNKGVVLALWLGMVLSGSAFAEPSYLIYPSAPAVFRYDVNRYEVIPTGAPMFDPGYAIGGEMLWDRIDQRVPVEIYRAPQLTSFEPSTSGVSEFVTYGNQFEIVVDGFGIGPRTLGSLYMRFWPEPARSSAIITLDGQLTDRSTVALPSLEVTTPLEGQFFSDTRSYPFTWIGAAAMQVIVFSDKNADGVFQGTAAYRIIARDATVPVAPVTWGQIKALYR